MAIASNRKAARKSTVLDTLAESLSARPFPKKPDPSRELMLCTLSETPFDDDQWIFEQKLDGLRVMCLFDGEKVTLLSRNNKPQHFQFPEIVRALKKSLKGPAILDGEIVCLDERGRSSFTAIQQRFGVQDPFTLAKRVKEFPAFLYAFDLLYFDQYDVKSLDLLTRKALLKEAVVWKDPIRWTDFIPARGKALLKHECSQQGEGIVAKKSSNSYLSGRSGSWIKLKCLLRQEFVIGGFTDPQGSRSGIGAVLLGYYDADKKFIYCGKVGTGFTAHTLAVLRAQLNGIKRKLNPFDGGVPLEGKGVHWVKPQLVAEIAFAEWTQGGALRQGRFEGLREDKDPKDVRRELPEV